ncbi:MAG: hypothetical protein ACRDNF_19080, partial [Streptosporangiaceae bacterium]
AEVASLREDLAETRRQQSTAAERAARAETERDLARGQADEARQALESARAELGRLRASAEPAGGDDATDRPAQRRRSPGGSGKKAGPGDG